MNGDRGSECAGPQQGRRRRYLTDQFFPDLVNIATCTLCLGKTSLVQPIHDVVSKTAIGSTHADISDCLVVIFGTVSQQTTMTKAPLCTTSRVEDLGNGSPGID